MSEHQRRIGAACRPDRCIMTELEVEKLSTLSLAHVGDGVYELLVRTMLCKPGVGRVNDLHKKTVALVKAPAQAAAMERILPMLTEKELAVYKRGRNTKTHAAPGKASVGEYHSATGLETLFGYLYLRGENDRIRALFDKIMEDEPCH